ncbi:hypothetical protein NDU88_006925 [Pleurodeles waltl]|uniref:Uncharacterized protein n=1 Tax=Pleurodeles waltl TaxID=8319 RepID=A0AAV7SQV8_PLEWA|nr:hypothetical protein NDU88_006925 [Pleurodeles waltl]
MENTGRSTKESACIIREGPSSGSQRGREGVAGREETCGAGRKAGEDGREETSVDGGMTEDSEPDSRPSPKNHWDAEKSGESRKDSHVLGGFRGRVTRLVAGGC